MDSIILIPIFLTLAFAQNCQVPTEWDFPILSEDSELNKIYKNTTEDISFITSTTYYYKVFFLDDVDTFSNL